MKERYTFTLSPKTKRMSEIISLKQQLEAFKNGTILNSRGDEGYKGSFNYHRWFCNSSFLENKAKRLFSIVAKFVKLHPEIDVEKVYVFFKNNCPMNERLYDEFGICDRETGEVLWTVTPKSGNNRMFEAYSRNNDFKEPIYKGKSMTEALKANVQADFV